MMTSYHFILPVLFLEYLSLSLTRSILPSLILNEFGGNSYLLIGLSESVKGLLSFLFCPLIGKLSDSFGRKYFILISMVGTTAPVFFLTYSQDMRVYTFLVALSGIFSATFSLTFAYISDCVEKSRCAPIYGLALATFGFSFTIGPFIGGYISTHYESKLVFRFANFLVLLNSLYIYFFLPETVREKSQMVIIY